MALNDGSLSATPIGAREDDLSMATFIPCPVCAGEMSYRSWPFLEGGGESRPMVDCQARHHARTEPHIYEALRLVRICEDLDREVMRLRSQGLLPIVDVTDVPLAGPAHPAGPSS